MRFIIVFLLLCLTFSCSSKKEVLYFQDSLDYPETQLTYEDATIQPNDILIIRVSAFIVETAIPYNIQQVTGNEGTGNNQNLDGYVVDKNYEINFPILGKISVKGFTTIQLEEELTKLLTDGGHLKDPTVNVRIANAKFTILGAIKAPGTINFTDQNITILQAIGLAGDLSINGNREDIILMREVDGVRQVTHLDLTSLDITQSPYYYIRPNDVIYVNPNGPEIKKAGYIPSLGALLGLASFTIGILLIVQNN